jgi:hypothetical protein
VVTITGGGGAVSGANILDESISNADISPTAAIDATKVAGDAELTGDQTIAGVKTFSSAPLIPDEVYGAGWNGKLEPPTKNAVYDKIETLFFPVCTSLIPLPDGGGVGDETTFGITDNTAQEFTRVVIPFKITVNKITIRPTAASTPGTLDLTLYSEDGQTQLFAVTTASIAGAELTSTAVGAVVLNPGIYYLGVNPNGTANVTLAAFQLITGAAAFSTTLGILGDVASEPDYRGQKAISAGAPLATFDPTSLSDQNHKSIIFRLDN